MTTSRTAGGSRFGLTGITSVGMQAALTGSVIAGSAGGNNPNPSIELTGVVRDFLIDHPDFDIVPPEGYGHYMWNVATNLGPDMKPVYVGGGYKVELDCMDDNDRPICWTLYNPDLGDTPAIPGNADTGQITSGETFNQWFRDIPGVNLSTLLTVTGALVDDGEYAGMFEINIPQFYPIDGLLFGNEYEEHNHNFTFEIVAEFVHDSSADYEIMFKSDDDVFVFLDRRMIADLGGVKGSPEQWVELNRLGLVDGETYRLSFFKTDRSGVSRFHLVTNIPLTSVIDGDITGAFD